jgi:murein L,D-transpeptidase YcbB/YkuD
MRSRAPTVWLVAAVSAFVIGGFVMGGAGAEENGKAAAAPSEWAAVDLGPPELPDVVADFSEKRPIETVNAAKDVESVHVANKLEIDLAPPDLPPVVLDSSSFRDAATVLAGRLAKGPALANPRLTRKDRESIAAFYAKQANKMVWLDNGSWTAAAKGIVAALERAGEEGLDPSDYRTPDINVLPKDGREEALADADIRLSVTAVNYARDARGARIDPTKLGKYVTPSLDLPQPAEVLDALMAAADAGAALAAYNPRQVGYLALKAKLAELRVSRPTVPQVKVPAGRTLKVGMRDPRVPLVRIRFGLGPDSDETYDERVAAAIADFQKENGLPVNGTLNPRTIAALASSHSAENEGDIVANMERWRWLPANLGSEYIMVNVPEFTLRYVRGGGLVHKARVITGKSESPTPIFSDQMEHLIVNPSWFVPPSILKNEFLPRMAQDPFYAARLGYEVVQRGNSISIRQPPGERNALGHIKFMFPNQHAVYLHDTPQRNLFAAERRTFSHGCVRLDQPFRFAEMILNRDSSDGWTEQKLRAMIGRGERTVRLKTVIPIHITYFTTFVDESGRLVSRDDVYGYNRRIRAALGYSG